MSIVIAAVDAGAAAEDATALAAVLAAACSAELLLLGVHPSPGLPLPEALRPTVAPRGELERALQELAAAEPAAVRTLVLDDRAPARAIQEQAGQLGVEIVVLGSSRRGTPHEAVAGRIAQQVLHDAPCPVAIATEGLAARGATLRRIVAGVDDAPESHAALALAQRLAHAAGAELRLVAVAEDDLPPARTPIGEVVRLTDWEEAVSHRRAHAERLLAGALDQVERDLPEARGEVRTGDPAEELATVAEGADLLVIGSRRWGPLARIALGSTGEELMRGAPCPLLLVPRPEREERQS